MLRENRPLSNFLTVVKRLTLACGLSVLFHSCLAGAQEACHELFARFSKAEKETAIEELINANHRTPLAGHRIEVGDDGKAVIHVGWMDATQVEFMASLQNALRVGAVSEIQTGRITGPKVLALIMLLPRLAPADEPVTIMGYTEPEVLEQKVKHGLEIGNTQNVHEKLKAFNEKEVDYFYKAVDTLGILKACLKNYGPSTGAPSLLLQGCKSMKFSMKSNAPNAIDWTKGDGSN